MSEPADSNKRGDAPEPPWRVLRPERPARPALTREAIVEAAIAVLDEDGADGLSMRRVAERLGAGAASLYWHVPSKAVLVDLVLDRVAGELVLPPPEPERWQQQLRELGHQMRELLNRHRDLGRLTLGRVPMGPNLVRFLEWQLALMRGAGVPDRVAALTGDLLVLYVGAFAYEDSVGMQSSTDEAVPIDSLMGQMFRDYLASLPPDQFPNTVQMADEVIFHGREERFDFGLDVLIRGLASFERDSS
jgi:AcrR family transcriptional regulator